MIKLSLVMIIITYSFNILAKEYQCSLDITPKGIEISRDKVNEFIKTFKFDSSKQKVGTKVSFKDFNIMMWMKNKMIITIFKDLKRKIAITTKFAPEQNEIYLKITPDIVVECLSPQSWKDKNKMLHSTIIPNITDETDLSVAKYNLTFKVDHNILFKYFQPNSNDKMRTIIFQEGKIIRNSYKKDKNKEWCAFQIEIKLDEDTIIYRGTELPPTKVKVLKNSPTHYVVSYSFIDFDSGKRQFHTSRYTPFSLECQLPKNKKLNYSLFRQITGQYLILQGK